MTDKQNYFTYTDNTSDDNDKTMEKLHKQTIIDGCDVSGCECYSEHREGYCGWHTPCEGDTCPYKLKWALQQLKHKEQECEELKEKCKKYGEINEQETKDYAELKAENEQLKEIIHKDRCTHYALGECSQEHHNNCVGRNQCIKDLEQENKKLKKVSCKFKDYCTCDTEKFLQTLTEIKEIVEKEVHTRMLFADKESFCDFNAILQKISEAVDGN